jgi:hypothetical protein
MPLSMFFRIATILQKFKNLPKRKKNASKFYSTMTVKPLLPMQNTALFTEL